MLFSKTQIERYADVLLWGLSKSRKKPFGKYDTILIVHDILALPLVEALHKKLIADKMHVVVRSTMSSLMEKNFFDFSDVMQRKFIPRGEREFLSSLSGYIVIHAPVSLTHLKNVDPESINEVAVTRKQLRNILNIREDRGIFSWTLCTYPTDTLARQASTSLSEYASQIKKACFLNTPDPVKRWDEIYNNATVIKKWLNSMKIKSLHIESASIDLHIDIGEMRQFIGISGRNIPSFEIFTSPDWRGTRGTYFSNQPAFRNGNYVEGVRLEFNKGTVIKAGAVKGGSFLKKTISMDAGASRLGEFSLTDRRFSRIDRFMADTLFDENYGGRQGNCHIALGSSYSNAYSGNPSRLTKQMKAKLGFNNSALHWDLVNTEKKTVTAIVRNGKKRVIYENGVFTC